MIIGLAWPSDRFNNCRILCWLLKISGDSVKKKNTDLCAVRWQQQKKPKIWEN